MRMILIVLEFFKKGEIHKINFDNLKYKIHHLYHISGIQKSGNKIVLCVHTNVPINLEYENILKCTKILLSLCSLSDATYSS